MTTTIARDAEVMEAEVPAALHIVGGGDIDMQIATAKRFPRSITQFKKVAMDMATLDEETAEACFYALPRDGKTVEGPSARLAEICASAWGNMRIEARQVGEDDRFVTARGTAWDLQVNVAIAYEVKRRITTSPKKGEPKKYSDDMVGVTSNAAASIALRNSVFKVIPAAYWKPVYHACRLAAVGDIKTLANRRAAMLQHFQKMGVTEGQVFVALAVAGVEDITLDHLATLKGLATALKDGETTIEEAFPAATTPIKPAERKSEQKTQAQESSQAPASESAGVEQGSQQGQARTREMPSAADGTVGGSSTTAAPKSVGVIVKVEPVSNGAFIHLDTGFVCSTRKAEFIKAAESNRDAKTRVELIAKLVDPKYVPVLEAIEPVGQGQ